MWQNERATGRTGGDGDLLGCLTLLALTLQHARCHSVHLLVAGYVCIVGACLMVLLVELPHPTDFDFKVVESASLGAAANASSADGALYLSGRMLRGARSRTSSLGGSSSTYSQELFFTLIDAGLWDVLFFLLSGGNLLTMLHFIMSAFWPFSAVHILLVSLRKSA